jgi:hypothetical protein
MEKRGLSNYIISWNGPDVPKVWVGDDMHAFWSGYGGVPRTACSGSYVVTSFEEAINNCPAPQYDRNTQSIIVCPCSCGDFDCERKNNCLRYFTNLHSLEENVVADEDLSASLYAGKWGKGDAPHGPFGPESDRDYRGNFDAPKYEK